MSCARFREAAGHWRDGTAELSTSGELAAHLKACAPCARDLEARELTCRAVASFLVDYVEGILAPAQQRLFEAHLARCTPCLEYLGSYRGTISLARAAHAGGAPPLPDELVRAILSARAGLPPT